MSNFFTDKSEEYDFLTTEAEKIKKKKEEENIFELE